MSFHFFLIFLMFPDRNVNKITKAPKSISKMMRQLQTEASGEEMWKGSITPFTYGVSVPALTPDLNPGFMGIDFDLV